MQLALYFTRLGVDFMRKYGPPHTLVFATRYSARCGRSRIALEYTVRSGKYTIPWLQFRAREGRRRLLYRLCPSNGRYERRECIRPGMRNREPQPLAVISGRAAAPIWGRYPTSG